VMDHTGAVFNDQGIDAEALARHVQTTGGVAGFETADAIDQATFYQTQVDMLVPAALEQMIGEEQAKLVNCRVVVEAANAPTTPQGQRVLQQRQVQILPAILCNAGGVTVSYLEWKQNRQAETWRPEIVDGQLQRYLATAAGRVKTKAKELGCDLRTAAYCVALHNISEVYRVRGIFP